jgi:hypothetical protein
MPESPFQNLLDDFNRSAQAYESGNVPHQLLLTKYSILMAYKAKTDPDRKALVEALYAGERRWLQKQCSPEKLYFRDYNVADAVGVLTRLLEPDSLPFLSREAPEQLGDHGLAVLRAAEDPRRKKDDNDSIGPLIKLADSIFGFSKKIETAQAVLPAPVRGKTETLAL